MLYSLSEIFPQTSLLKRAAVLLLYRNGIGVEHAMRDHAFPQRRWYAFQAREEIIELLTGDDALIDDSLEDFFRQQEGGLT